ncbi:MAG: amino acid ABC transporter substrate-binding protein [Alphaproteobacteria bacterium]|nr:amino acid ABC transporter substrate-binding protein [Alphaproteobacteria bacterium]MBO6863482.1 amino acid ABC transporter substrate-binding protein [Alphaproteobacteria bacterium]
MKLKSILVAGAAMAMSATIANAATLDDVKARGELNCIVTTGLVGFAYTDESGKWNGFDVDFCRGVAAAVLGDGMKVKFVPTTGKTRFTALNAGEGDVLYRNTTVTMSRDADLKLTFLGVNYYDGQGFMVSKDLGVTSAKELDGASVCIQTGTTTELNLADYFRATGMSYEPVPIETNEEARTNYLAGRCDVYTTDASGLAASRATFDDPKNHIILPEIISKEPLGPAVRQGDDDWADINRWVLNAIIEAEEFGITSANVDEMAANPPNPSVARILGVEGNYGEMIGLDNEWAKRVIKAVGNYGEIFDRNIGPNTEIGLERGLNAQWKDGGILYSAPIFFISNIPCVCRFSWQTSARIFSGCDPALDWAQPLQKFGGP